MAFLAVPVALLSAPWLAYAEVECGAARTPAQADEALALYHQGRQRLQAADWPAAEAAFREAVRIDPLQALAHYGLGETLLNLKRHSEAVAAFLGSREAFRCLAGRSVEERRALERQRDQEIADLREGLRKLERERLQLQMTAWREMNSDAPTPSLAASLRLVTAMEARLAELELWRRRADPVPLGVTRALGGAHFLAGQLADAEREFRAVIAADARSGEAHNDLAVVLMLTGRLDEAEREVKLAQRAGIQVSPRLKEEIRKRRQATP